MEMLFNVRDAEPERGHGEEAVVLGKELTNMKQNFVDAWLDSGALHDRVDEHAGCAQATVGERSPLRLDAPDLDAQAGRWPSTRDVNSVNRNATRHLTIPPFHGQP